MIHKCAICGKEFDALWPDLYRYKRGGTFLCSWSCLRKYDNEKGSGNMARMKKDGTPAKKPGPKPAVELVYVVGPRECYLELAAVLQQLDETIGQPHLTQAEEETHLAARDLQQRYGVHAALLEVGLRLRVQADDVLTHQVVHRTLGLRLSVDHHNAPREIHSGQIVDFGLVVM